MLLNVMDVKGLPMLSGVDASWVMKGAWPNRFNAVEGVDYRLTESDTKLEILKWQVNTIRFYVERIVASSALFLRIYVPYTSSIELWGATAAFRVECPAGWHSLKLEFFANGQNRYTLDGVVRYTGTIRGAVYVVWTGSGTLLADIGNRGGALPAGFEWW